MRSLTSSRGRRAVLRSRAGRLRCGLSVRPRAVGERGRCEPGLPALSEPTPTPPPDPAIGWVSPATDRIKRLHRRPGGDDRGGHIRRVVFTVTWKNGSKTACTSAKPDSHGRWACSANLLKVGVAPGSIDLAAQAFNTSEQAIKGASDVRSLTYAVVPPRPGSVAMKVLSDDWADDDTHTEVDSFTWTAPKGYAKSSACTA